MACFHCGSDNLDAAGVCRQCGAPNYAGPVAVGDRAAQRAQPRPAADPAATNPGSGLFCGRCGSAIAGPAEFCGICGQPLGAVAHPARAASAPPAPPVAETAPAAAEPPEEDYATSLIRSIDFTVNTKALKRRFEPSCLVAILTVTLVVVATIVGYLVLFSHQ